jgi:hypothetical protein
MEFKKGDVYYVESKDASKISIRRLSEDGNDLYSTSRIIITDLNTSNVIVNYVYSSNYLFGSYKLVRPAHPHEIAWLEECEKAKELVKPYDCVEMPYVNRHSYHSITHPLFSTGDIVEVTNPGLVYPNHPVRLAFGFSRAGNVSNGTQLKIVEMVVVNDNVPVIIGQDITNPTEHVVIEINGVRLKINAAIPSNKTKFSKDDYIVLLNEDYMRFSTSFKPHHCLKQREESDYIRPYLDCSGSGRNGWGEIKFKNLGISWRYATHDEALQYDKVGKPYCTKEFSLETDARFVQNLKEVNFHLNNAKVDSNDQSWEFRTINLSNNLKPNTNGNTEINNSIKIERLVPRVTSGQRPTGSTIRGRTSQRTVESRCIIYNQSVIRG